MTMVDCLSLQSIQELTNKLAEGGDLSALYGSSTKGEEFSRETRLIVKNAGVPECPGVYLWLARQPGRCDASIYVGKSWNLRKRITETLCEERIVFWSRWSKARSQGIDDDQLVEETCKLYGHDNYRANCERALLKTDATHIAWLALARTNKAELGATETYLIKTLQPLANGNLRRGFEAQTTLVLQEFKQALVPSP
jgi:hypothetical protein